MTNGEQKHETSTLSKHYVAAVSTSASHVTPSTPVLHVQQTAKNRQTSGWRRRKSSQHTINIFTPTEWPSAYQHLTLNRCQSFFFFLFFPISCIIFALLFSLPPSRNSDPGSHSRLFSRPTHYGSCLAFFFSREDFSSFFPRRLASNYVTKYGDILYINV